MEDSRDNFRDYVVEKLKSQVKPTESLAADGPSTEGPLSVYLIFDQKDDEAVAPIEDYLFEQGLEVMKHLFLQQTYFQCTKNILS